MLQMENAAKNSRLQLDYNVASFLCGAGAGAASTITSNPFEALKTRMSGSKDSVGAADRRLRTHLSLLFKDGFLRGSSVGLLANLVTSVPSNAVYLPTYNYVKESLITSYGYHPTLTPFGAAVFAVCTTNLTLSPFFVVRTAVQLDSSLNMRRAVQAIASRDGYRGFYRGLPTNIAGRIVEEGLFWLIYENGKRFTDKKVEVARSNTLLYSVASVLSWSMISKLFGVCLAFPYNTIMTHQRGVNKVTGKHDYNRVSDAVSAIYKAEGVTGFYRGLIPQLLRSVISKSTQVLVFEYLITAYTRSNGIVRPT